MIAGSGVLVGRNPGGFAIVDRRRCVIGRHVHARRLVALAHFTKRHSSSRFSAQFLFSFIFGFSVL